MNQPDERLRKKKHCLTSTAVFLVLLGAPLLLSQHVPDSQKNPFARNRAAIAKGRKLFSQPCMACHGSEGRGGRGPALAAGRFAHGSADSDLFQNIRHGIPGTQMPSFSVLPTAEVWQLVSYIQSLSSAGAGKEEVARSDAADGEKLFFGKGACSRCHEVNGRGTVNVGPDLSAIGQIS